MKEWLKNASANFVGSLLGGMIVLYIGTFMVHQATTPAATDQLPESVKTSLQGVHHLSSHVLGLLHSREDSPKTHKDLKTSL